LQPAPILSSDAFVRHICDELSLDPADIALDVPLSELAFDSVLVTELGLVVEDLMGAATDVVITDAHFKPQATLGGLYQQYVLSTVQVESR
jgi:ABC-type lipopolysaccharide export system ATPase subunit